MPATVKRLRIGLLLAALALLAVLAGFFFVARWKDRLLRRDLPQRLGLNIQQDSNGFTLSKSEHGQTLFTLHAGRAVQLKDSSQAMLHDVQIVLYGQGEPRRQDMIRGESFTYDPHSQVATSQGEVTIDLQAPSAASGTAATAAPIHLRTTQLTFDQKTGRASTPQRVEFRLPRMEGTAVGADYDASQGTIALHDQVRLHMDLDGGPATLSAASAQMERGDWQLHLARPVLHTLLRDASADNAVLWLRHDSSVERVSGEGAVRMATPDSVVVTAPGVMATFDARSRIQTMNASGGVSLHQPANSAGESRQGSAQTTAVEFDTRGKPRSLRMNGSAALQDNKSGAQGWQRNLHASNIQVAFVDGVASQVIARGQPVLEQHGTGADGDKSLKADVLEARLRDGKAIESVHGTGHTVLAQSVTGKESETSTGDVLTANFAPQSGGGASQIQDAVQTGNVRLERRSAPAQPGTAGDVLIAHAQQADYRGQRETVLLTGDARSGNPRMTDKSPQQATTEIVAHQIELFRLTEEAIVDGAVQATYLSRPGAQAAHVVASHAVMARSSGTVTFTGSPRMWQQGNSVQAPLIVLDQRSQGMTADAGANSGAFVRTVLVNQQPKSKQEQQPVRIRSQKLVYSGADRRARFSNAVTLFSQDGAIRTDQADVFFKPSVASSQKGKQAEAAAPVMMNGNVERIVADGDVFFSQLEPRRQGTGQELVYSADDGKFTLTGSPGRKPRIEDPQQGTVSGDELQFFSHEERVEVISSSGRTVTTTRVTK